MNANSTSMSAFARFTLVLLALSLLVSACGFKLKQAQALPFHSLYTNIAENSAFGAQLRRMVSANSPQLRWTNSPEQASAQLLAINQNRYQRELSLDPNGNVEDYELLLSIEFTLIDQNGHELISPTTLTAIREIPNNPNAVHATHMEIQSVFQHMELSLVEQMMRRLSADEVKHAYMRSQQQDSLPLLPDANPPASATSFD